MTAALSWLNDLIQWLGRWIPRLVLIEPTHRGVRFGLGGNSVAVGPGLVMYWPITQALTLVAVTRQSIQLCGIQLPIADEGSLLPRVAVCTLNLQFSVIDAIRAATHILDFHALVSNRAQALAAQHWPGSLPTDDTWIAHAKTQLRGELSTYGMELDSMDVAGLGLGVVLKNVSDWSYADSSKARVQHGATA